MTLLLAFLPFIAFVAIERLVGTLSGLSVAALISVALLVRDRIRGMEVKILELGTSILFSAVTVWGLIEGVDSWSIAGVRLGIDLGLLVIVLTSLTVRQPFTLQYARAGVSAETASSPGFMRINNVITGVWAAAFAVMVMADLLLLYRPDIPTRVAVFLTLAAAYGAFKFTNWYPVHAAAQARGAA